MITFDPRRPLPPMVRKNKVERLKRLDNENEQEYQPRSDRRRNDRRSRPFLHRGLFEMRSGADRRLDPNIDEKA